MEENDFKRSRQQEYHENRRPVYALDIDSKLGSAIGLQVLSISRHFMRGKTFSAKWSTADYLIEALTRVKQAKDDGFAMGPIEEAVWNCEIHSSDA